MALALRWHHTPTWTCVGSRPIRPWHFLYALQLSLNSSPIAHHCCLEWKNLFSTWGIQFERNISLGPIRHWKGRLPSGSTRSSPVCPKDVWQLFHPLSLCIVQSLFKSTHYDLIDSLVLSIPLWIGQSGILVFYSQIATISPEGFTIKLKSIVRDEGMGDSKPCDNILPNKSFGIHVSDICQ